MPPRGWAANTRISLPRAAPKAIVNDINGAEDAVAAITDAGGLAIENRGDVADPDQAEGLVRQAMDTWGRLDAVVNNAGVYGASLPDPAETSRILGVHLVATINTTRSALPIFRCQRYGRILNVGSGSMFGVPGTGIYATGKRVSSPSPGRWPKTLNWRTIRISKSI